VIAVGYTVSLGLALVFAVAAGAKFGRPANTVRSFEALGLGRLARPLAVVVPLVELALALGLVFVPEIAAAVALLLLGLFSAVLVRALMAGVEVGCGCFGGLDRHPVRALDIARNGALALAAVVAWRWPGPSAVDVASLVVVSLAVMAGLLLVALWELRHTTGAVWRLDLPRESA
jgi:Methylamine utilisation protein MauE